MQPGKYVFMIDPIWNSTVHNDDIYKEVMVDIYAPDQVNLSQVEDDHGMQILARALKGAAMNLSPPEQR